MQRRNVRLSLDPPALYRLSVGSLLQGTQHVEALGGMPMSLHTVEAVSRLAASAKLPRPFLGPFVSRRVAACQSSQVRDAGCAWH